MGEERKNKFLIKRSNVPGKIPDPTALTLGELALNTNDVKLYSKDSSDVVKEIGWDKLSLNGGTINGDLIVSGDMTSDNFIGNGSQLTNVPDNFTTQSVFDSSTNIATFSTVNDPSAYTLDLGILDADITSTIWAEESDVLTNGGEEWSFGNGAIGPTRLYTLFDGEIKKMFIHSEQQGTLVTIDVILDGVVVGTGVFNSNGVYDFPTPITFTEGQAIGFRTNNVVGTWLDNRTGVGLIQKVKGLKGPKGDNGGSTDQNGLTFISDFTSISSSGQNFPSTTNGVLLANDALGGVTRPKPNGVFNYDSTNFWFDVSNLFSSTGAVACSVQFRVKLVPLAGNGFFDVEVVAYGDRNNIPGSQLFSNSNGLVRAQPTTGLPANPAPIFNILASENVDVLRVFTYSQNNNEQVELNLFQVDYKLYF